MRFFRLDRFPLVVATAPSGQDADQDITAFYREWDEVIERGRHVVLIDLTDVRAVLIGARERRRIAEEANRRHDGFRRSLIAEARLCPNPSVRAMMTAFDWLVKKPFGHPIAHFDGRNAAEHWLLERYGERREGRRTT